MEQLDLNQIRTFVRIVQAGSFTKAAENLRQPKSRVSRRLSALEKALGVSLIYRTTRQFQLTESGRIYYERCRELVESPENISLETQDNTTKISGLIRLTASDDMGAQLLSPILDEFNRHYPLIQFDVFLTQSYLDLVKESIDVAVRIGKLKDSNLRIKKVQTLRNILVATPGFIERYRQIDDFEQLINLPFFCLGDQNKIQLIKASEPKKITLKMKVAFQSNNPSMLVSMVLRGRGFALIPEFLCQDHLKSGKLIHIHKSFQGEEVPLSLVTPEQKEIPPKIKLFMEFMAKKLRESLQT